MTGVRDRRLRVLFVSHDASSTGAPNSLLNFLDYVRARDLLDFRVVLLRGGPLEPAFDKRGPSLVLRNGAEGASLVGRGLASVTRRGKLAAFLAGFEPDLVWVNSVAAAPVFADLRVPDVPVVTYVRELEAWVRKTMATGWFEELVKRTSVFFCVSEAVRRNLVERHAMRTDRFAVVPTSIDPTALDRIAPAEARRRLHALMRGTDCKHVVVGCGTTDWRKVPDLFIAAAKAFFTAHPRHPTRFLWLGGMGPADERRSVEHDVRKSGLATRVFFPGARHDAAALLAGADVLALTSREDPFPRVMLEAGFVGVPTVCFKGSGGAEEFIAKGTGIAVDYLDVARFSRALYNLLQNPDRRRRLGARARRTVQREYRTEVCAARILAKLRATLRLPAGRNGQRS